MSSYPTVSMNDFTSFATRCKILDHDKIKLADLDLILTATAVSTNQYINSQALDMRRYEFLEMICRVGFEECKLGREKKLPKAIENLLEHRIYPNQESMNGEWFRKYHCYAYKVNEILKKNESQI